jgi:hypothetical protein
MDRPAAPMERSSWSSVESHRGEMRVCERRVLRGCAECGNTDMRRTGRRANRRAMELTHGESEGDGNHARAGKNGN